MSRQLDARPVLTASHDDLGAGGELEMGIDSVAMQIAILLLTRPGNARRVKRVIEGRSIAMYFTSLPALCCSCFHLLPLVFELLCSSPPLLLFLTHVSSCLCLRGAGSLSY